MTDTNESNFEEIIDDMFEEYMVNGFDFSSDMTFEEVFKKIFKDAVEMALETMEEQDDE